MTMRHTFELQLQPKLRSTNAWLNREQLPIFRLARAVSQIPEAKLEVSLRDTDPAGRVVVTLAGMPLEQCLVLLGQEKRKPLSSLAGYRQIETEE